jgi:hypothetical protein
MVKSFVRIASPRLLVLFVFTASALVFGPGTSLSAGGTARSYQTGGAGTAAEVTEMLKEHDDALNQNDGCF